MTFEEIPPLLTVSSKSTYQVNTPQFGRLVLGTAHTLVLNTTLALSNLLRVLEAKIYPFFSSTPFNNY